MAMCDDLKQQQTILASNLAAVDNAIDQTTDAGTLQNLRSQQAQLRGQLSHVETLINQNCGVAVSVAAIAGTPAATRQLVKARKEHHAALTALTTKSVALAGATLRRHKLPAAPKATVKKAATKKKGR